MIIHKILLSILIPSVLFGCSGPSQFTPMTKYLPEQHENVFPFFSKGQPIAAVQSRETFLLLSLEPTYITGKPYMRLWLLYQNLSDKPYLLEPLNFCSLTTTRISKGISESSVPESPTTILAHISNEKEKKRILTAIGGALQSLAVKPSTATTQVQEGYGYGKPVVTATTTLHDEAAKRAEVLNRTSESIADTEMWYDIYRKSISEGILRRNTVFPGQSVNGYIYFPFPLPSEIGEKSGPLCMDYVNFFYSRDFKHIVFLDVTTEPKEIEFMPIAGE